MEASGQEPASAGWYPAARGMLRYWDGAAWTDRYAAAPTGPAPVAARGRRGAQVMGIVAVAMVVCLVLVAMAWAVSGDFLIDDSQPVITLTPSVR